MGIQLEVVVFMISFNPRMYVRSTVTLDKRTREWALYCLGGGPTPILKNQNLGI